MCPIMFNNTSHLFDEIASNNKDIQKDKGNIVSIYRRARRTKDKNNNISITLSIRIWKRTTFVKIAI